MADVIIWNSLISFIQTLSTLTQLSMSSRPSRESDRILHVVIHKGRVSIYHERPKVLKEMLHHFSNYCAGFG